MLIDAVERKVCCFEQPSDGRQIGFCRRVTHRDRVMPHEQYQSILAVRVVLFVVSHRIKPRRCCLSQDRPLA